MAGRTVAVGDVHGDIEHLEILVGRLPALDADDTIVFLGDHVDRGPRSAQVVEYVRRTLPARTPARIVALRGNHEDGWGRVATTGWPEFLLPPGSRCPACLRSFAGRPPRAEEELATGENLRAMFLA